MVRKINILRRKFEKEILEIMESQIMPTNNEAIYIIKVIRSLENREILLKGTTKKIIVKKEDYSILLHHYQELLYH